jgi:hypothetical protein
MTKPKVFVGSSAANVNVAHAIADGLAHCATVTVWDEGIFRLNDAFLQRLIDATNQYDFAVMVWAPDDITDSKGQSQASPRDNVIFECGLFMGALGLAHVFVVQDSEVITKTPSDFAGITVATYDGARMKQEPQAAVGSACRAIEAEISSVPKDLEGEWRQRYMEFGDIEPRCLEEDIEIAAFATTVSFTRYGKPGNDVVFEARGRLRDNRIRGEWHHMKSTNRGPFLLVLNTADDVMFGYSGASDPDGGAVFEAWILAKKETKEKEGRTDAKIAEMLAWGEETLRQRTVGLPTMAVAAVR